MKRSKVSNAGRQNWKHHVKLRYIANGCIFLTFLIRATFILLILHTFLHK